MYQFGLSGARYRADLVAILCLITEAWSGHELHTQISSLTILNSIFIRQSDLHGVYYNLAALKLFL